MIRATALDGLSSAISNLDEDVVRNTEAYLSVYGKEKELATQGYGRRDTDQLAASTMFGLASCNPDALREIGTALLKIVPLTLTDEGFRSKYGPEISNLTAKALTSCLLFLAKLAERPDGRRELPIPDDISPDVYRLSPAWHIFAQAGDGIVNQAVGRRINQDHKMRSALRNAFRAALRTLASD